VLARQILPEHSPGLSWKLAEEIIVEKVKKKKDAEEPKFLGKTSAVPEDFLLVEVSSFYSLETL